MGIARSLQVLREEIEDGLSIHFLRAQLKNGRCAHSRDAARCDDHRVHRYLAMDRLDKLLRFGCAFAQSIDDDQKSPRPQQSQDKIFLQFFIAHHFLQAFDDCEQQIVRFPLDQYRKHLVAGQAMLSGFS